LRLAFQSVSLEPVARQYETRSIVNTALATDSAAISATLRSLGGHGDEQSAVPGSIVEAEAVLVLPAGTFWQSSVMVEFRPAGSFANMTVASIDIQSGSFHSQCPDEATTRSIEPAWLQSQTQFEAASSRANVSLCNLVNSEAGEQGPGTMIIRFRAIAMNTSHVIAGGYVNATASFGSIGRGIGHGAPLASFVNGIPVVEPSLALSGLVTSPMPLLLEAGDRFNVQGVILHAGSSSSNAFGIELFD